MRRKLLETMRRSQVVAPNQQSQSEVVCPAKGGAGRSEPHKLDHPFRSSCRSSPRWLDERDSNRELARGCQAVRRGALLRGGNCDPTYQSGRGLLD